MVVNLAFLFFLSFLYVLCEFLKKAWHVITVNHF